MRTTINEEATRMQAEVAAFVDNLPDPGPDTAIALVNIFVMQAVFMSRLLGAPRDVIAAWLRHVADAVLGDFRVEFRFPTLHEGDCAQLH